MNILFNTIHLKNNSDALKFFKILKSFDFKFIESTPCNIERDSEYVKEAGLKIISMQSIFCKLQNKQIRYDIWSDQDVLLRHLTQHVLKTDWFKNIKYFIFGSPALRLFSTLSCSKFNFIDVALNPILFLIRANILLENKLLLEAVENCNFANDYYSIAILQQHNFLTNGICYHLFSDSYSVLTSLKYKHIHYSNRKYEILSKKDIQNLKSLLPYLSPECNLTIEINEPFNIEETNFLCDSLRSILQ